MGELSDCVIAFFLTCLSYQLIKSVLKSFLINRPVWLAGGLSDSVGIFRLVLDDKIMVGEAPIADHRNHTNPSNNNSTKKTSSLDLREFLCHGFRQN